MESIYCDIFMFGIFILFYAFVMDPYNSKAAPPEQSESSQPRIKSGPLSDLASMHGTFQQRSHGGYYIMRLLWFYDRGNMPRELLPHHLRCMRYRVGRHPILRGPVKSTSFIVSRRGQGNPVVKTVHPGSYRFYSRKDNTKEFVYLGRKYQRLGRREARAIANSMENVMGLSWICFGDWGVGELILLQMVEWIVEEDTGHDGDDEDNCE
ncbi:hypothetical protein F5Y11DRAFT_310128 [Daldinia sp. FL1419]|nr:hypothetical protein F5Y11DRAFT_310128 [Daldinia sp. FL1419]